MIVYDELRDLTEKKVTTVHNNTKNIRAIVKIGIFITYWNFVLNLRDLALVRVLAGLVPQKKRFCIGIIWFYSKNQPDYSYNNKKARDLFTGFQNDRYLF